MTSRQIDRITIEGFKSIRSLRDFPLGPVNVLIGANGAGKSNFVSFFSLLRELVEERLQLAVNKAGRADSLLYMGVQMTQRFAAKLNFGLNAYEFVFEPTVDQRLVFADERILYHGIPKHHHSADRSIGKGHSESALRQQITEQTQNIRISAYIYDAISRWIVYHFHDTGELSPLRGVRSVRDYEQLRANGSNLAAFLYRLKQDQPDDYRLIVDTVRLVTPFFREFVFRPQTSNGDEVLSLEWHQTDSDFPFHAGQFSDGTLRFIALATALLQPNPPATILIDEPELGLHPSALDTLAGLIRQASVKTQLIISTQSAALLNAFEPEEVIVVDRQKGESIFRRLTAEELKEWLNEEYTLGDLWQKNVYGGGPVHD